MDRVSLYKLLGQPESFGVLLLSFSFVLLLAPYFSGADFGLFKIPIFTKKAKKRLKIIGPVLVLVSAFPFVPIFSSTTNPSRTASAVMEPVVTLRKLIRKSKFEAVVDQFYILLFTKHDTQVVGASRRPGTGHYEISDEKPFGPQRIDGIPLIPGHGSVMYIMIVKADGNPPSNWQQRAEELLKAAVDPKVMSEHDAAGMTRDIVGLLEIGEGVDVIGSLAVQVTNQDGALKSRWFQTLGAVAKNEASDKIVEFKFEYDGSHYTGEFFLDESQGPK